MDKSFATGRHTGGSNFALADGHAKYLRGSQVSAGQNAVNPTDPEKSVPAGNGNYANQNAAGTSALGPGEAVTFSRI